jgi:glucosamine--fructose-6-phosphate aminotransferase (isomerizing)
MATLSGEKLWLKKDVGWVAEVDQKHRLQDLPGETGIGHVRWATHGGITLDNAHPHLDCTGRVAVVHNGIIENYQELRQRLSARHRLTSETDTEVIPHLIEEYLEEGHPMEEAVRLALQQLTGSYAIAAVFSGEPAKLVGARHDSPLVAGVASGSLFLASDALAFLEHTDQVLFPEDGEVVVLNGNGEVRCLDRQGQPMERTPKPLGWSSQEVSKNGHDFFMLKEILEQPETMRCALDQDPDHMNSLAMDILRARQVVITACGTSRYAALVGRYLFSRLAGKFCDVVMGSEFHYFSDSIDKTTVVIAVSQSGKTADVVEGVKRAKANGAQVLSLVNAPGSYLARISDQVIPLNCGPEICVAATKSFVNQLVVFYLLASAMMGRPNGILHDIEEISHLIEKNIRDTDETIKAVAKATYHREHFYYIARGINFAIAVEGALKLKELAYIHAEGMPAGELKHGTLALIEEGTPVVAVCPRDYTFSETLSNAMEARSRGGLIIGVSDQNNPVFHHWLPIPEVEEAYYPLVSVVPLQLLAYHLSVLRGKNPDRPRNLAKSVTVK